MASGKVKWFDPAKGYGFIGQNGQEEDVFVHHNAVSGEDLQDGEQVEFDVEEGPKGLKATNVQRADQETF